MRYHNAGDLESAKDLYQKVLHMDEHHADALHFLGVIEYQYKNDSEAVRLITQSLAIDPDNSDAYYNLGLVLQREGQLAEAISSYQKSLELDPANYIVINHMGTLQHEMKNYAAAIHSFDATLNIHPTFAQAYFNRGLTFQLLRNYPKSLENYIKALEYNPDYARAYNNQGIVLHQTGQYHEAITSYQNAIRLDCDSPEFYINLAISLLELKANVDALKNLQTALRLSPSYAYLPGRILHLKRHLCEWDDSATDIETLASGIQESRRMISPFVALSILDSSALQKKVAEIYYNDLYGKNIESPLLPAYPKKDRIRIGYFSADFRNHALALLMSEFFSLQDKSRFDPIGFSLKTATEDPLQSKVRNTFDLFFDLENQPDAAILKLARDLQLDIAVDLGGYTQHNRFSLFVERLAPLQVSYLGFLGTSGSPCMDYLIADRILIPVESQPFYAEKIIYLPCYQVNPSNRIASPPCARSDYGLTEQVFVYGCFCNTFKLNPMLFDSWMRILSQVPQSVLFMYADDAVAMNNLQQEAAARGVHPDRLIFGKRLAVPEYLGRFRSVDLLLDTLPYNGGTTVSDALWMGVPVLTCMGSSFASRIAASILEAAGCTELITTSMEEYEAAAIEFGTTPALLDTFRKRLTTDLAKTALYDTKKFATSLETAFSQIHQRSCNNLPTEHLHFVAEDLSAI